MEMRKELLRMYNSAALAPTIEIMNTTHSHIFHFKMKQFSEVRLHGFEMNDYFNASIRYNHHCLANREIYEGDVVSVTFNKDKTWSQVSTCFYSYDPFSSWTSCLPAGLNDTKTSSKRVIAFLIDYKQYTGIGLETYARSETLTASVVSLYYDHLGALHLMTLNKSKSDRLEIRKLDVLILVEEVNKLFDYVLCPQYITVQQIIFFEHNSTRRKGSIKSSKIRNLSKGQVIQYWPVGAGLVVSDFPLGHSLHYLSSVIVNVLEKFPVESEGSSPCVKHTLTVTKGLKDTSVTLHLSNPGTNGFRSTDVEKTVVIPGSSSFLITRILASKTAIAEPTMPDKVPFNRSFASKQWFLHDFGTINGKKCNLKLEECRYLMQDYNNIAKNSIKYLDLNTTYIFRFRAVLQYTAYPMFQMRLINLVVGDPSLVEVNAKEDWDEMDSYTLEFSVCSKHYKPHTLIISISKSRLYRQDSSVVRLLEIPELYKKCVNKTSQAECNCTLAEKMSSLSAFSDCTEKIYVDDAVTFSEKHFIWILAIVLLVGIIFAASLRQNYDGIIKNKET